MDQMMLKFSNNNTRQYDLEIQMVHTIYREFLKNKIKKLYYKEPAFSDVRLKKSKMSDEYFVSLKDDEKNDIKIKYFYECFDNGNNEIVESCVNDEVILLDCKFDGTYVDELYNADVEKYLEFDRLKKEQELNQKNNIKGLFLYLLNYINHQNSNIPLEKSEPSYSNHIWKNILLNNFMKMNKKSSFCINDGDIEMKII